MAAGGGSEVRDGSPSRVRAYEKPEGEKDNAERAAVVAAVTRAEGNDGGKFTMIHGFGAKRSRCSICWCLFSLYRRGHPWQ